MKSLEVKQKYFAEVSFSGSSFFIFKPQQNHKEKKKKVILSPKRPSTCKCNNFMKDKVTNDIKAGHRIEKLVSNKPNRNQQIV